MASPLLTRRQGLSAADQKAGPKGWSLWSRYPMAENWSGPKATREGGETSQALYILVFCGQCWQTHPISLQSEKIASAKSWRYALSRYRRWYDKKFDLN
ncbi:hypothetical protein JTE90_003466 [Oedothorax gibbosus]|uniref:Uncharacterized protein n=1 Tax=Oedothorax gibbosus TaxID=931172 RepID=A0AAV6U407_9ARAC|nr:hypothetical protein JTE90_003466 [Oedothorax gibbosus]